MVFHYFHQNIAKTTGFIRFLSTLDAKTKENQWFLNIFSKIFQKPFVCGQVPILWAPVHLSSWRALTMIALQ